VARLVFCLALALDLPRYRKAALKCQLERNPGQRVGDGRHSSRTTHMEFRDEVCHWSFIPYRGLGGLAVA